VQPIDLTITSVNKEKEYLTFHTEVEAYLKKTGFTENQDEFVDHYRLYAGKNLTEESPKH